MEKVMERMRMRKSEGEKKREWRKERKEINRVQLTVMTILLVLLRKLSMHLVQDLQEVPNSYAFKQQKQPTSLLLSSSFPAPSFIPSIFIFYLSLCMSGCLIPYGWILWALAATDFVPWHVHIRQRFLRSDSREFSR
jgi:hypothetical protein